jgi:hypothetical protein
MGNEINRNNSSCKALQRLEENKMPIPVFIPYREIGNSRVATPNKSEIPSPEAVGSKTGKF